MIRKIRNTITEYKIIDRAKQRPYISAAIALAIIFVGYNIVSAQFEGGNSLQVKAKTQQVRLYDVSASSDTNETISTVGEVEALDQIEYKSEVAARVTDVHVSIGDEVQKGDVLVELDNGELSAQYTQAQAAIQSASAQLQQAQSALRQQEALFEQIKNGARPQELLISESKLNDAQRAYIEAQAAYDQEVINTKVSLDEARSALESARQKAQVDTGNLYSGISDVIASAYTQANSAVNVQTDQFFDRDDTISPKLTFLTSADGAKSQLENSMRLTAKTTVTDLLDLSKNPGVTDAQREDSLRKTSSYLSTIQTYLNLLNEALNGAQYILVEDVLNAYKTSITSSRSGIDAALTSVNAQLQSIESQKVNGPSSVKSAEDRLAQVQISTDKALLNAQTRLNSAKTSLSIAEQEYSLTKEGARDEQIRSNEEMVAQMRANVSAARGSLLSAQANARSIGARLSKTRFVSPIDGVIGSLSVRIGELVTNGQRIVSVINDDGIQIRASVNSREIGVLAPGTKVQIEGGHNGEIANLAPSVDSVTKKVEVIVIVTDEDSRLVIGEFVDMQFLVGEELRANGIYLIPLKAIKIDASSSVVFKVNEENRVTSHEVFLGRVVGDKVEVTQGLNGSEKIVETAQTLRDNVQVEIIE